MNDFRPILNVEVGVIVAERVLRSDKSHSEEHEISAKESGVINTVSNNAVMR
jgi:hypothetical protein